MLRGNSRFHRAGLFLALAAIAVSASGAQAGVVWYVNDYAGWAAAAGNVYTIDFETLPDGSPSVASTPITLDFNYTDQGVTFSGPVAPPFITGNPISTFALSLDASPDSYPNWITADLVTPARAVGVWFPAATILELYDEADNLIDSRVATKGGSLGFVGAISNDPIASSISTINSTHVTILSYHFAPIPEPTTAALFGAGAVLVMFGRAVPAQRCSRGNSRFHRGGPFLVLAAIAVSASEAHAGVVWYVNDYAGWAAAAGDVHTIDFETLPDGSPSVASTPITLDFNYTDQGVTFSGPVTIPFIAGNNETGFSLRVSSSPDLDRNWIIADLVDPAYAVGIHFNTTSDLSLFDANHSLIASAFINGPGGTVFFLGAISTESVFSATSDRGIATQDIMAFHLAPVPEPATLNLMGCAVMAIAGWPVARSTTAPRPRHPHR